MIFHKIGKLVFQVCLTTFAVMSLVIAMLATLPDYATFDNDNTVDISIERSTDSYFSKNVQFWKALVFEDLGKSKVNKNYSVGEILRRESRVTFLILFSSISIGLLLGAVLGFYSAYKNALVISKFIDFLGLMVSSLPIFMLVPGLIFFFSVKWNLFPPALWEGPQSLVLPVVALSVRPIFFLARIFRDQLLETSKAGFVLTAHAKGLRNRYVWFFHILPNSLKAFITAGGNLFGQFITSLFLVELLFALPGLGSLFVKSLLQRDYPLFLGNVFVFTLVLQMGHRLADLFLSRVGETMFTDSEILG